MVLRKQPPPRLDHSNKWYNRFESRSQTSPTAQSASSPSPKRLTRPRRAQSSPHPRRIPSAESIYSPDLNTSPAFDLMPIEQAQRSPQGVTSEPSNPWEDEIPERSNQGYQGYSGSAPHSAPIHNTLEDDAMVDGRLQKPMPPLPGSGNPYTMDPNEWQKPGLDDTAEWDNWGQGQQQQQPVQLQSNNPFLKPKQPEQNPWGSQTQGLPGSAEASRSVSLVGSDRLSQGDGYIPMTARLSLLDEPASESPWAEERPVQPHENQQFAQEPGYQVSQNSTDQVPMKIYLADGQVYNQHETHAPPAVFPENTGLPSYDSQPHYLSQYTQPQPENNRSSPGDRINTPSGGSSAATPSSHELIDLDDTPKPDPDEYRPYPVRLPSSVYESDAHEKSINLPPNNVPSLPRRKPVNSEQPLSQPTPNVPSANDANRANEQAAEPYSIRHINWTDITGALRQSPVLVQNKNGPCPLLALVNSLVLRAGKDTHPPIVRALQTREQISLGLLIEAMFEELTTCLGPDDEFPDIEALSRFLTMLHTGMNVNPRITLESQGAVGSFYQTSDIQLYSTFGVPLVHGWVVDPSTETNAAFGRVAKYHEDIQLLHFRKEELENRVIEGGSLTTEEQQIMHDIQLIQQFVDIENVTQLSNFGLDHLAENLAPGSVSILFRNDHFSTLYKHPQLHKLFTLVTDAGYSGHVEVVWESLVDVNGSKAEFSAGDFRPVSHNPSGASDPSGPPVSNGRQSTPAVPEEQQQTVLSPQEQADADYAYALSLQFQEEERRENNEDNGNRSRNRPASTPHFPSGQAQGVRAAHNRSSSAVNGGRGRYSERQSAGNEEAPPSYEHAAASPAYSPHRSPSNPNPNPSREYPHSRNLYGRHPGPSSVSAGLPDRRKDRDCIVM